MYRRLQLIGAAGLVAAALATTGCSDAAAGERSAAQRRVLILGVDGMDPRLLKDLMGAGRMPNFARIAEAGTFIPLETAAPPQSPVAWSNFITGMNPGGHGIFDFIHRDPSTMLPYLSQTTNQWQACLSTQLRTNHRKHARKPCGARGLPVGSSGLIPS